MPYLKTKAKKKKKHSSVALAISGNILTKMLYIAKPKHSCIELFFGYRIEENLGSSRTTVIFDGVRAEKQSEWLNDTQIYLLRL